MTAEELLLAHGIHLTDTSPGRYYSVCPQCSAKRSKKHQHARCLGITITDDGARWGCSHCGWKGPAKGSNGNGSAHGTKYVATYDYLDETGALLFQVCRTQTKQFPQRKPDGNGGWIWSTAGVRKVLYRLPEVIEAIATEHTVLVVEGEKDADNLQRIGIPATCSPGGAAKPGQTSKWRAEYSETLRGADVVIIPDNDPAGRAHAQASAAMSLGIAQRVRILDLSKHWPEMPKGGDVSDWIAAAHTREELDALIAAAPDFTALPAQAETVAADEAPPAFSDEALALRFAQRHAATLRYVALWSRWMIWDGSTWKADDTRLAFNLSFAHRSRHRGT